ncbi:uncharacterized protein LOC126898449 isoform X2 [Daktulosphaira vitifoliae]|uniref:uncharacterized protein LOC126898449 isoform X2 n=1 Tax=Daktulosphaira vitifoliae TaxID=58002 RepID=UPI0021AAD59E|nr:uncharacterized protein LOC126898449 isoform X2 [Daktulosphaira vitifoliae]
MFNNVGSIFVVSLDCQKDREPSNDIDSIEIILLRGAGGCLCHMSTNLPSLLQINARNSKLLRTLSTWRLMLTTYRRQLKRGQVCPAIAQNCDRFFTFYCGELIRLSKAECLVDALTSIRDVYAAYLASCVFADAYVVCTDRACRVNVINVLCSAFTATEPNRSVLGIVVSTVQRILVDKNEPGQVPPDGFCDSAVDQSIDGADDAKRDVLLELHDCWPDAVGAMADCWHAGEVAVFVDFVQLWKSILVAIDAAAADMPFHSIFGSCLFQLRLVLCGPGTVLDVGHTRSWINLVQLSGAALSCSRTATAAFGLSEAVTSNVPSLLHRLAQVQNRLRADQFGRRRAVQETVLLVLKCLRAAAKATRRTADQCIELLDSYVKCTGTVDVPVPFCRWIVILFRDRDDLMVESALCALDTVLVRPDPTPPDLNPFGTFVQFMNCVCCQADVLLDFLISDEKTLLLRYMLKILKLICNNPEDFFRTCGDRLDDIMGALIRLHLKIIRLREKNIFPYYITPIINLIEICDNLYSNRM